MRAEIICIGTELLMGEIVNTRMQNILQKNFKK
jgi:molybdopterin-biosynthesis enzyme MoeA-like protein